MTETTEAPAITVAVATNNPAILSANLALSPDIAEGRLGLHVVRDAPSASVAYNAALDATDAPVVVFAHHDVYLPRGWAALLRQRIAAIAAADPGWGVIGAYGIGYDGWGYGPVWSSSVGAIIGRVAPEPLTAQSFDELLLVVRRDAGLRFDPKLPNFHLYGTDIAQTARAAGRGRWWTALPLVHNDQYHDQLGEDFGAPYRYLQHKWRAALPIQTSVTHLTRFGIDLARTRWRNARWRGARKAIALPNARDPRDYAALCGWYDLTPRG
jgi:glycosyltransferase involved in cell wall biosynthesis